MNKRKRIIEIIKYKQKGRLSDDGINEEFDYGENKILVVTGLNKRAFNYSVTYLYNSSEIIDCEEK